MSIVDELSEAATKALASAGPSVVRIGSGPGRGCGVVVGVGVVVTNAHNLRGATTTVTFAGGRQATGTVSGTDVDGDLAAIEVDTGDTAAAHWAPRPAAAGQVAFAVARDAGGGDRVSFGLVSGTERAFRGPRGRRIKGTIEHTAPLPRGSSGSPVVDADGAVLGLSTNRLGEGFYLALPADDELRGRIEGLRSGHVPRRPRLGVGLAPAHVARALRRSVGLEARDGLLVRAVEEGSPADAAGLREGDLLVAADGLALTTSDDLHDALDRAGAELRVTVVRGNDDIEAVVVL
ncbi:MAG: S1C family serine protease [Acidimicrobiia bacterium]